MITLTIYSRPGCHLCDEMKGLVRRVAAEWPDAISIDDVDIDTDPDLQARYGLEIPVLTIGGRKVAKYRISEEELRRTLRAREGE